MTSERLPAAWRAMIGTARGAAHDARGLPNQDSAESLAIAQAAGTVVAVADGHGHDRHFRSAAGSKLAVRTACAVVAGLAADGGSQPWSPERAAALRDQLPEAIVARWREAVTLDIAAHPYTAEELSALEQARDGPSIPYGSTLLVALIADGWLVCAQIGDGDLLAVQPDGGAWSPVSGDDLLDGYRTTSLCQPVAVSSFRAAAHDLRARPLLALLLSTDGYGNAQAEEPWQPVVARDLAELAARHDHRWFAEQLPAWAERCASAAGSADDTTIALLLAPGSERLAAAAHPIPAADRAVGRSLIAEVTQPPRQVPTAPPPATGSTGTLFRGAGSPGAGSPGVASPEGTPAGPRFSRRRAVVAGVAAVAAAAVIAVAVVLSQSPGSGHPPPALQPTGQPAPRATLSSGTVSASVQPAAPSGTRSGPASRAGHPSAGGSAATKVTNTTPGGTTHGQPAGTKSTGNQGG
jgi:Protein phosphatase 2C